ncbi:MAG: MerR family DNA-binding protein [Longimicrobiales bacterium]
MGLTVGALARAAGVGVQTIRFYERQGLLEEAPRSSSGYRWFGEDAVNRLRFVRRAQELGFTLREIRELIALQEDQLADCADVDRAAAGKLDDINRRIADLQRMKGALEDLMQSCTRRGPVAHCAIIECLATG